MSMKNFKIRMINPNSDETWITLLAAALLEALEELVSVLTATKTLTTDKQVMEYNRRLSAAISKAKIVIAKAKGE